MIFNHLLSQSHVLDEMRFSYLLPIHLAIAISVTIDALLRKRDIGALLGWVGLVWLSPFLGGFFYFVFGINRVRRRAARLKRRPRKRGQPEQAADKETDDRLEPLQRGIGRVSRRLLETDNAVETFQNGDEAYPAMIAAINAARNSIGLSTYIFDIDETGKQFVAALRDAVSRGVKVRVIVDGVGAGWIRSKAYHALRDAGVKAGRFLHSPLPWRMPLVNLRSHKKILVVDGTTGFTGGMNIASNNVMALQPKHPVADTHFRVKGPVVAQLVDAFADDWAFVSGEDLDGYSWFPVIVPAGQAKARVITSGPDQDLEKIEFSILQAISCARSSIYVMTPYFLPDDRLMTALALAAQRGVAVHVAIPKHSNYILIDWASRANLGSVLRDGVNVWLGPPPFRHTKIMVVDGEWALIGSANWDLRSLRLNFEVCMEVYDQTIAQSLQHFITSHRGVALTNTELKARSFAMRLRDAAARLLMPYL